ncbi:adenosine deaminase [Arthrobacter sp. Soil762]|uniref:adenosine deaminase n=1 Tax=Arthrobacter sp. Soil762 TaxID=1736401 RepID=UPI0006FAFEA6|nr:adenosine deaminase [Arthrobacter sp. Soil762]KRE72707.1 adenosine deaminase [Arthrobacter sp. Soil762]
MSVTKSRLIQLPKAELHLHIEGTLEPELVFKLARRNGVELPYRDESDLSQQYAFENLQSFLNLYYECMAVLRTREDFADLARSYFAKAKEQGVRHVEMFFDPQAHVSRGVDFDEVVEGLHQAIGEAWTEHGISGGLILSFLRDEPLETAQDVWSKAKERPERFVAVGLDSAEVGFPPGPFAPIFAEARALGLRAVAHAGEEGPPSYINGALDALKVDRIDHGIRAMEDPELVRRLVRDAVPLTVCPLSNVRLGCVQDLADHGLLAMLDEGLIVTVNSDDPAYFGGYVGDNFVAVDSALGLDDATAAQLARNSIRAAFAPTDRKQALLELIDQWEGAA